MRITLAVAVACLTLGGLATAEEATAAIRQPTDIPAEGLGPALTTLAKMFDFQVLYRTEVVGKLRTEGASGAMTASEALEQVLTGTGLTYKYLDEKTVTVIPMSTGDSGQSSVTNASASPDDAKTSKEVGKKTSQDFRLAQVDQGKGSGPSPVREQNSNSQENSSSPSVGLQEIIVTAQKRQERLQDVPIAISAFTQDSINEYSITDISSLSRMVPSLSFTASGGEPIISIRGLSTGYGLEPAVSVYIDDTPLDMRTDAFSGATLIDLFDLDHIEVLRGPQGTLFGASSMGGEIRVITAQPDPTQFSATTELGASDIDRGGPGYDAKGAVNLPLSGTLALRIVGTHSLDGGWIDRSLPTTFTEITPDEPITRRNENIVDRSSFRAAMRWTPDDTWAITPSFIYQNIATQSFPLYYGNAGLFVRPHVFTDQGSFNAAISSLKIEKDFGPVTLTSATAYINKHTLQNDDWAEFGQFFAGLAGLGTIVPTIPYVLPVSYHEFTEELRLTSKNTGEWRWIVGTYFNSTTQVNTEFANSSAFLPAGTSDVYFYDAPVHDRQLAGFGELTFTPNEHLDVTGGLRAYQFHTVEQITQGGLFGGPDVPQTSGSNSGVNPKLTSTYKLDPSISLYATVAKGFREGGVNSGLAASTGSDCTFLSAYKTLYGSDTVWNYEVGAKTTFLEGRGAFNASLFQLEWNNFQGPVISSCGSYTANIGKAQTRGVEIESNYSFTSNLSTHATFSYDDATIKSLSAGLETAGVGLPGERIVDVPKVQFSLGANLDLPSFGTWKWFLRPNWQYVGSTPSSYTTQSAAATQPSFSNVNLVSGFHKDGWEYSLYVHNLTNSLQIVGVLPPLYGASLDGYQYFTNPPRTFGFTFRYKY